MHTNGTSAPAMDDDNFTPIAEAYKAAYGLTTGSTGPQCSSSSDFCLFCEYSSDGVVREMKQLVHTLAADKKEIPVIAEALRRAYEDTVRKDVTWEPPGCPRVDAPEWTVPSIKRHLLYSSEFAGLFNSAITQMFHAIITKQNESMIDANTGLVVEEHRAAFTDTVKAFIKFEQHRDRSGSRQ